VRCCSTAAEAIAVPTAAGDEIRRPAGMRQDRPGRLLRGYLHKSSNSLCGIKGYASLIAGGGAVSGRTTAWARKIIDEVERLEVIYRSVKDMAFPAPAPGDASSGLLPVLVDASAAAAVRHRNLLVGPLPRVRARLLLPPGDLLQILAAILDNSAEARPGPVAVAITTSPGADGRTVLHLADDGPGMPRELLAQVLDPFVTTRPGHLGIGLARVDTIMDMHGLGWGLRSLPQQGTTVSLEVARPEGAGPTR
jgi:signal transduction histidine kinase